MIERAVKPGAHFLATLTRIGNNGLTGKSLQAMYRWRRRDEGFWASRTGYKP
jgi:hypothetical protein